MEENLCAGVVTVAVLKLRTRYRDSDSQKSYADIYVKVLDARLNNFVVSIVTVYSGRDEAISKIDSFNLQEVSHTNVFILQVRNHRGIIIEHCFGIGYHRDRTTERADSD